MKQHPIKIVSLGMQHMLAMYAGAIIVPLIVGGGLGLNQKELTYLVSIDLLMCGVATILQALSNRFFGIGLPVVLGCTFTAVGPMIAIGKQYGVSSIYGAIIAAGLFVVIFAKLFGKLVKLFPPVVTGSVVTVIGVTLVPAAINDMAGGVGSKDFGSLENLALAFGVLLFIIIMYRFFDGFIRSISILLGLLFGTIVAAFMGKVSLQAVGEADWFHGIQPFYFGTPTFELTPIITMILVACVGIVEATGVYFALSDICNKKIGEKELTKGYRAEGLAMVLGGIFNAFPYTTYSQNVGLVQLTGVRNRVIIYTCGGMLIVLGFIPKIAAITTIIPKSVLGGAMLAMFGMVMAYGIKMLSSVDFGRQENLLIVACSVGIGLGVTVVPTLFSQLPESIRILTDNGIVLGSASAVLLNIVFNMVPQRKVKVKEEPVSMQSAVREA
ncbi:MULTISPECIES: xanthine permease PbuX [Bacillus cereus group]|uniref:xanthine permease PbuX n=1 Tax=Bacillus cereus group TaxID=86661 RepID=UPI0022E318AC|nr:MULTISPECIES: xanthine permease [unclassified Bacillus cereus group]MDA2663593.1 xanthine permease [Bacillus cereus group sp. Bc032]MDA2674311.1 xanthine permease [Bacillus cereus group sp. Bc031]MDA2679661.1 xanthine permease [Bacillus cereus group sp. Bc029]MDA2685250.1 xanthine permease [Bacillus cereus group sp. Bc030]MDA2740646.1 xanthine permease [Bacillus cereus group sp. Bc011]